MAKYLDAFTDSLILLWDNPSIVGAVFALSLISMPSSAAQVLPISSLVRIFIMIFAGLALYLLMPFFQGGIFGMIKEAKETSSTGYQTFIKEGKTHYVRLLVAYVLFAIILFAVLVIFIIGAVLVGLLASSGLGGPGVGLFFILFFMLIAFLLIFSLLFFIQFFDVGVVIGGYGVLETFRESLRFVWKRKLSVIGFLTLYVLIMIPNMIPSFALSLTQPSDEIFTTLPIGKAALYLALTLVLSTVFGAISNTYKAVYYMEAGEEPIKIHDAGKTD